MASRRWKSPCIYGACDEAQATLTVVRVMVATDNSETADRAVR
ncbi:MAG TPA: hypothetical protein VKA82_22985 [Rubrobacter sp.]|nr:hypothetical protein [Rubrobacter sp.]